MDADKSIDIPTSDTTSDHGELHSFVKLSIAYIGIIAGLAAIGMVFYVVAARVEAAGRSLYPPQEYFGTVEFFSTLIVLPIIGIRLMLNHRRIGAYVAFGVLAVSVFAPYGPLGSGFPLYPVFWIVIPNSAVGVLLAMRMKTLSQ